MVVECPACQTRYRVDAGLVVAGETSFECCQEECGHIFVYTPPVLWRGNGQECETEPLNLPSQSEAAHKDAQEIDPEDESGFNDADSSDRLPAFVGQEIEPSPPTEGQGRAPQAEQDERNEPDVEPEGQSLADLQAELLAAPHIGPEDEAQPPAGDAGPENPVAADLPPAALLSVRNVLALLGSVVFGYVLLSYSALAHPGQTQQILGQLPMVGSLFAVEPFSARHIRLDGLSGSFWLSKDNRRVFAVAGTALNTARVSAKRVRIEGTLYNGVGEQVGQQRVFCGSEARAELLANLTVRDINTLQKFVPPQGFHIPAGRTAACLLVFTRPPGSVAEISGRVVSVQFEDA